MVTDSETEGKHLETIAIVERDGLTAAYRIEDFAHWGLTMTRLPEDELGHEEEWNWSEAARMIRNHTMRIYGMEPEVVKDLDV